MSCSDRLALGVKLGGGHGSKYGKRAQIQRSNFYTGKQIVYFYFFKRPKCYNQEVLSDSFICLPLPYIEGIVLICNIDLYCVIPIFSGTGNMFNRWHFYTLSTNWSNKSSSRSLTHWCSHLTCLPHFQTSNNDHHRIVSKQLWAIGG